MTFKIIIFVFVTLAFSACSEEKKVPSEAKTSMKCGAGKCGSNMFDGNSALAKKKKNVLSQMRDDDKRRACVIDAKSAKEVYDCVRNPITNKLSLKCGNATKEMKCGASKCGSK